MEARWSRLEVIKLTHCNIPVLIFDTIQRISASYTQKILPNSDSSQYAESNKNGLEASDPCKWHCSFFPIRRKVPT